MCPRWGHLSGVDKAGAVSALSPPRFCHLEDAGWPGCLPFFWNSALQIPVPSWSSSRLHPSTHTFFLPVAFSSLQTSPYNVFQEASQPEQSQARKTNSKERRRARAESFGVSCQPF